MSFAVCIARSIVVVVVVLLLLASSPSPTTTIVGVDARRTSSTTTAPAVPSPSSSGRRSLPSFVVPRRASVRSTAVGGGGGDGASPLLLLLLRASSSSSSSSVAKNDRPSPSAPPLPSAPSSADRDPPAPQSPFRHTLAILTTPASTSDRILNEAILDASLASTSPAGKLSVVLRTSKSLKYESGHTLSELRTCVGEIYSTLWDRAVGSDDDDDDDDDAEEWEEEGGEEEDDGEGGGATGQRRGFASTGNLMDVVVYPQNLPNAAPEQWIVHRPSLDAICSSDRITGWSSEGTAGGSGSSHANVAGEGQGGLDEHVVAVNDDRKGRGLGRVTPIRVEGDAEPGDDEDVVFLEDEEEEEEARGGKSSSRRSGDDGEVNGGGILGGARIPSTSLFRSVAVGGTFDGMHYGHRKLLTLAASSVEPNVGRLLVGVTVDDMLTSKSYAEHIPPLRERMEGVKQFLYDLAPGMKNRLRVVPISDPYGPPGSPVDDPSGNNNVPNDFDALVLSHETLPTGRKLNRRRVEELGLRPLKLLCTRRTEPHGMSSTALRRIRSMRRRGSGGR